MIQLFQEGGILFMSIITLELVTLTGVFMFFFLKRDQYHLSKGIFMIRQLGLLAFISGVLGQAIGLYGALKGIEMMGGQISPEMLAGGLKVSMICNIYGIIVFCLGIILSLLLKAMTKYHKDTGKH